MFSNLTPANFYKSLNTSSVIISASIKLIVNSLNFTLDFYNF